MADRNGSVPDDLAPGCDAGARNLIGEYVLIPNANAFASTHPRIYSLLGSGEVVENREDTARPPQA